MLEKILEFHAWTKNPVPDLRHGQEVEAKSETALYKLYRKAYPRFPAIALKNPKRRRSNLQRAIRNRESGRAYASSALDYETLCHVLSGMRVIDNKRSPERRSYASAGALFPVELYVIAYDVAGLSADTAYHLNLRLDSLEELWCLDENHPRQHIVSDDMSGCAAALVLTAVLSRSAQKYGEKAYGFAYFEAGQIAQNMALISAEADLAACLVGGFIDQTVSLALDLPEDEIPVSVVALGHKETVDG